MGRVTNKAKIGNGISFKDPNYKPKDSLADTIFSHPVSFLYTKSSKQKDRAT